MNSVQNKSDSLVHIRKDNNEQPLISEIKIESSFPTAQFYVNRSTTYRRHRNVNGGEILLYARDNIPSDIISIDESIKGLYVEIKIRKKKWLSICLYNP